MQTRMAYIAALCAALFCSGQRAALADVRTGTACAATAASALGTIADALSSTSGPGSHPEDARTLKAALEASSRLRACGNERDSISAELIAADAYSDVYPNDPQKRCSALRDARSRLRVLNDRKRANMVSRTLLTGTDCR